MSNGTDPLAGIASRKVEERDGQLNLKGDQMGDEEKQGEAVSLYVGLYAVDGIDFDEMFEAANVLQAKVCEETGARDVGGSTSFPEEGGFERDLDFEVDDVAQAGRVVSAVARLVNESSEFESHARFSMVTPEERAATLLRLAGEDAPPMETA